MPLKILDVRAAPSANPEGEPGDPILTEVIRHGLNATAEQMKVVLRRTAFSPVIYEALDFACALYDTNYRMLSQARALPQFLGTLGYCLEAAVTRLGGLAAVRPGDVIWSTSGYDNGSHPQDAALIVPAFHDGELIAFSVTKAHQLDIAAKDLYSTDTTDNFQEGVIFPGVKLYDGGHLQEDMYRTVLANSRLPAALAGDLNAQIAAATTGAAGVIRLVSRYGLSEFLELVEFMYNHGEATTRAFLASVPDGRYAATGVLDDDGITDTPVEFPISVEVKGSDVVVDFTAAPRQRAGPVNCPLPTTVSTARLSILGLMGGADLPNEGHFRPITIRVTEGSLFCPTPPAPIFLYGWTGDQATETIHRAMAEALPAALPAGSGGDLCGLVFWGTRPDGTLWATALTHSAGQGATHAQDGGSPLIIVSCSGTRTTPAEVIEARYPLVVERCELAADSGGAGRFRGGCGSNIEYRVLEDMYLTSTVERTRLQPWGLCSGGDGRANKLRVEYPDGREVSLGKKTRVSLTPGTRLRLETGGGGGHGPAWERLADAVLEDIGSGFLTLERAQTTYPHAFSSSAGADRDDGNARSRGVVGESIIGTIESAAPQQTM